MSKIVLCVDDSVTMQRVAEITFSGTELTYVGARSVDEALQKAQAQKPALILADAVMPGKSGYDLCAAIRADGKLATVPVYILCGNGAAYDAAKGAQVGADGTLTKPWDSQAMFDKCLELSATQSSARAGGSAPAAAAVAPAPAPARPSSVPAAAAGAPRNATMMGMPSIKPAAPAPAPAAVAAAPAPAARPASAPVMQAHAPAASASASVATPARAPLVAGQPLKKSALVERTMAKMAAQLSEASGLPAGSPELAALLRLSTEVVERVVWEVVPELAEAIIRENVAQLAARRN